MKNNQKIRTLQNIKHVFKHLLIPCLWSLRNKDEEDTTPDPKFLPVHRKANEESQEH